MTKNGLFSFLSASNYYRDLRSHRLRLMWRLGAIRHRSVAGERLRAAGPAFTAPSTLAGATLPQIDELVLLDHDQAAEEEPEALLGGRRSVPVRRVRNAGRAAERSVGRSDVELTQALAQIESLLQGSGREEIRTVVREIPSLAPERRVQAVREVIRTIERQPTAAIRHDAVAPRTRPSSRVAPPTQVLAPTLSPPVSPAVAPPASETPTRGPAPAPSARRRPQAPVVERIAARAEAGEIAALPVRRRVEPMAERPLAVAANRTQTVVDGFEQRLRPLVQQGPTGLQPILRSSPAIRAAGETLVDRVARRPEVVERMSRDVYTSAPARVSRQALPPSARIALEQPGDEPDQELGAGAATRAVSIPARTARTRRSQIATEAPIPVPLSPQKADAQPSDAPAPRPAATERQSPAPLRRERLGPVPTHQAASVLRGRQSVRTSEAPTARIARTLVSQTVAEPDAIVRGVAATGRAPQAPVSRRAIGGSAPEPALPRVSARGQAGISSRDVAAPLAASATSWLSDVLHPERRVERARRLATPEARSLAVAQSLPVLDHGSDEGTPDVARSAVPAVRQTPVRRRISDDAPVVGVGAAPTRIRHSDSPRPTLRAATRAIPDPERVAPSPVRSPISRGAVLARQPVLLDTETVAEPVEAGRRSTGAAAVHPAPSARPTPESTPVRPAVRAARRLARPTEAEQAVAPLFDRKVSVSAPEAVPTRTLRTSTGSASVDMVAITHAANEESAGAVPARPRPVAAIAAAVDAARAPVDALPSVVAASEARADRARVVEEPSLDQPGRIRRPTVAGVEPTVLARPLGADEVEAEVPQLGVPAGPGPSSPRAPATRRAAQRADERNNGRAGGEDGNRTEDGGGQAHHRLGGKARVAQPECRGDQRQEDENSAQDVEGRLLHRSAILTSLGDQSA